MVVKSCRRFKVPCSLDVINSDNAEDKVVVIAVIGKSRFSNYSTKASVLNPMLKEDIFEGNIGLKGEDSSNKELLDLECHHDCNERIIYVHLTSVADPTKLKDACLHVAQGTPVLDHINNAEVQHARALLLIFSIAHIIVVNHPSTSFDMDWVRLFRALDVARLKAQPEVSTLLTSSAVSKEWANMARPCSPRVLFVFETTLLDSESLGESGMSKSRSQKTPPHKRLQHSLEDQIYRILRKARIITNISNNSLFAVPANQEFVFVSNKKVESEEKDPVLFYMSHLQENSVLDGSRGRGFSSSRKSTPTSQSEISSQSVMSTTKEYSTFKAFLGQHTHLALAKGFDDNVGRNPVPAHFELPTAKAWLSVANKLFKFFLLSEDVKSSWASALHSLVEIDVRFSETRCLKVLPLAESAYQEGLPSHYITSYHITKLAQAKRIFSQHARGPACGKYLKQLEEDCEKIWKNGRQLCEETSLTGNHCVNELHRLADAMETDENKHLPEMNHSSQVKTKVACNCGRKQSDREDPFTHKAANFEFYDKLETSCCGLLEHFKLPLFQPSTPEAKAAIYPTQKPGITLKKDVSKADLVQGMSGLSLALSLGQSGVSENMYSSQNNLPESESQRNFQEESPASQMNAQEVEEIVKEAEETESSSSTGPIRQHSTTEYLPSMIHTKSVPGLLPIFPSWALTCLGKYSSYNPSHGLDQPGFFHCCNFLLPWEVSIHGDKEKWPSIADLGSKKSRRKGQKDSGELSVTVYLGHEYECPRGHRFFISAPDKIFKAPATGQFKENAYKLIHQDSPLYFPCQCRNSKGSIAQLMRVHIVVPEGPLRVDLKPLIQPGAAPCPLFHPGTDGPLVLPSAGHWVLRFPYIYVGDKGPHYMPSDPQLFMACRLLKGLYNFQEIST